MSHESSILLAARLDISVDIDGQGRPEAHVGHPVKEDKQGT